MSLPNITQTSPSKLPVLKAALTEHIIVGATGIRCDADGLLDLEFNGVACPMNVSKGETPPIRGNFTILNTTDIATQVLY